MAETEHVGFALRRRPTRAKAAVALTASPTSPEADGVDRCRRERGGWPQARKECRLGWFVDFSQSLHFRALPRLRSSLN